MHVDFLCLDHIARHCIAYPNSKLSEKMTGFIAYRLKAIKLKACCVCTVKALQVLRLQ